MKIYSTEGIIFRTLKYSETSIICDIYTKAKGLRSFIVSGVRTSKVGSKAAIYRHLNIVDIISHDQEADKLARINEITLNYHYNSINKDVILSSMAIFMLEVSRNAIKEKESNEDLYTFIKDWLVFIDTQPNLNPHWHLLFMIELSTYLGFGPMDNHSGEKPYFDMLEGIFCDYHAGSEYILDDEDSLVLFMLCQVNRINLHNLQFTKIERDRLTDNLLKFYKLHLPSFRDLNSVGVLRSVL